MASIYGPSRTSASTLSDYDNAEHNAKHNAERAEHDAKHNAKRETKNYVTFTKSVTRPGRPKEGDVWHDTIDRNVYINRGWTKDSIIDKENLIVYTKSTTMPTNPKEGDVWHDTNERFFYLNGEWIKDTINASDASLLYEKTGHLKPSELVNNHYFFDNLTLRMLWLNDINTIHFYIYDNLISYSFYAKMNTGENNSYSIVKNDLFDIDTERLVAFPPNSNFQFTNEPQYLECVLCCVIKNKNIDLIDNKLYVNVNFF